MKTYKQKIIKEIDKVYCDICGSSCTRDQLGHDYGILEASWGYGSKQDGTVYEIHLCENCFSATINFLKSQRSQSITLPDEDPLNGKSCLL